MDTQYDLIVIGAGPGGYVAAIRAGQLGLKTAIIEKKNIGGICLNEGCIPSKALIHVSESYHQISGLKSMGVTVEGAHLDWSKSVAWKDRIVKRLTGGVSSLLEKAGVEVISGKAGFVDANTIVVARDDGEQKLTAKHFILATGSKPFEAPSLPFDSEKIIDSTAALALETIPEKMIVVGGGYIGLELGTVFAMAGSSVTVVELMDGLLPGQPREAVQVVERNLRRLKIKSHLQTKATGYEVNGDKVSLSIEDQEGNTESLEADVVLVTVGRKPFDGDVGLDAVGLSLDEKGFLPVDDHQQTEVSNIYAIGDLAPGPMLAHKASAEALVAVDNIAGKDVSFGERAVPGVVFTFPEIATVGVTSDQMEQGHDAASFPYIALGRSLTMGNSDGYLKWIFEKETKTVIGAEIVGPEASNLISEAALAVQNGLTLEDVAYTIHPHPTLGEGLHEAAELGLGLPIHIPKP